MIEITMVVVVFVVITDIINVVEERDIINRMEHIKQSSTYCLNFEMYMIAMKEAMFTSTLTQTFYKLNPKH